MKKYIIWNKIDKINGIDANYYIKELNIRDNDEVFLIGESLDTVNIIEISRIIKLNYNLDPGLSVEEVAQEYLKIKQREEESSKDYQDKISILEAENLALLESQKVQDRTIVENDMRMMDLECALEDLVTSINPTTKINLMEVFSMFGRSATYFNQLKQMIEMENYDSKEEMERILNKYKSGRNPRITQEEYDQLFDLLYPPVYDIPTAIPEV